MPRKVSARIKARNKVTPLGGRKPSTIQGPLLVRDDRIDVDGVLIEDIDFDNTTFGARRNHSINTKS